MTIKENHQTRLTLIQRLQNSPCDQSWEDFVKTYENYIFAIILKMGVPHEDCKDVMQSVLLDAWKALPKFEYRKGKSRFRSWLSVITRHATCRFYRKFSQPVEATNAIENITEPEIERIAEEEWKSFIAKKAFDNIKCLFSEQVLEIFLCISKQMKDVEIAKQYDISPSSVRVYKMRVQKALQKEIIRLNRDLG